MKASKIAMKLRLILLYVFAPALYKRERRTRTVQAYERIIKKS